MNGSSLKTLDEAIRHSGEGWILDSFAPAEEAMSHIQQVLQDVEKEADRRLGGNAPSFSEVSLLQEYQTHPLQVRGFFQALGGTRSIQMLLMVWRVIQGMEIQEVEMNYKYKDLFTIRVILQSPYGEVDAPYESNNIHDFALFRHIGIMEIGNAPVLDGFYALKVRGTA